MTQNLKSKFLGALVGSALGDAVGDEIVHKRLAPSFHFTWEMVLLDHTAPTAMAMGLAESLVAKHDLDEKNLGDRLRVHFFREARWQCDEATAAVLGKYESGSYCDLAKSIGKGIQPDRLAVSVAAMRVAPLVFFYDTEELYEKVEAQALVTHTNPVIIDGAAVVAKALTTATTLETIHPFDPFAFCDTLISFCRSDVVRAGMHLVKSCLEDNLDAGSVRRLFGRDFEACQSVGFAIYSFLKNLSSFRDCLRCATENGSDASAVGAMACAMSGAFLGIEAIPKTWHDHLTDVGEIERSAAWLWEIKTGGRPNVDKFVKLWEAEARIEFVSLWKAGGDPEQMGLFDDELLEQHDPQLPSIPSRCLSPKTCYSVHFRDELEDKPTYAQLWKDWATWLSKCDWEHLELLLKCQETLEQVLQARRGDVSEGVEITLDKLDFSKSRKGDPQQWRDSNDLKRDLVWYCQTLYQAYRKDDPKLQESANDRAQWFFSEYEYNLAWMVKVVISKALYSGTDKENQLF
jgi:poly(ADP-ribose) glycohydrolase ARH3